MASPTTPPLTPPSHPLLLLNMTTTGVGRERLLALRREEGCEGSSFHTYWTTPLRSGGQQKPLPLVKTPVVTDWQRAGREEGKNHVSLSGTERNRKFIFRPPRSILHTCLPRIFFAPSCFYVHSLRGVHAGTHPTGCSSVKLHSLRADTLQCDRTKQSLEGLQHK